MDYGKITKEELIKLCEERKLSFSSSWKKEELEELLIKNDKDNQKLIKNKKNEDNKIGNVGAIVNIVLGSISLIPWAILSFAIIGIPFFIGTICSIVSNVRYKNGKKNKKMAGILGIIFSGIIGGIMVLMGE